MDDLISRQAAIDAIMSTDETGYIYWKTHYKDLIYALSPAQSEHEITDEQAIEHLQSSGWMQNHDKQMYEMGLKEQLMDDSGSYDSLIPERKPGRWIDIGTIMSVFRFKCSECGARESAMSDYCPKCGSYMRGNMG